MYVLTVCQTLCLSADIRPGTALVYPQQGVADAFVIARETVNAAIGDVSVTLGDQFLCLSLFFRHTEHIYRSLIKEHSSPFMSPAGCPRNRPRTQSLLSSRRTARPSASSRDWDIP